MSIKPPDHAFIMAAGMGSRLRPHTDTIPKPLVPVDGRAMIDHTLDHLEEIGTAHVTVNLHYRAALLQNHLSRRAARHPAPRLTFSWEPELLDTGGGIKKALYTMGGKPFYCFSGDTLWEDGKSGNTLEKLAAAFDAEKMDLILLLQPLSKMTETKGSGDYDLDDQGRPIRNRQRQGKYFWPSIRICHPRLFENTPDGKFSFLDLMDRAEEQGRLRALLHDGTCHHITTPDDLARINAHYAGRPPRGPKAA